MGTGDHDSIEIGKGEMLFPSAMIQKIQAMIEVEVERQLNARWNQMVNEARLGSAMKFEPMRPVTDSRGIPHHMMQGGEQKA